MFNTKLLSVLIVVYDLAHASNVTTIGLFNVTEPEFLSLCKK